MRTAVTHRKDFWTGAVYIVIGIAAFLIARNYPLGTADRMGPGYFPSVVALLLIGVGAAIVGRAFFRPGPRLEPFAWKAMLFVIGAITAFGLLINRGGLIVAGVVLVLGCAAASQRFRLGILPLLGLAGLIVFCVLVFVIGMGIPLPLAGAWFDGY